MNIETAVKEAKEWNEKGKSFRALDRYPEAIACYDRAIELQPQFANVWFNKGNALRDFGKPEEALVCFERAIAIKEGTDASGWYAKGDILESLQKHQEAIACYDQAIAINPAFVDAWNNKGAALFLSGEYVNALTCFERAIEIQPKYITAWNNKGRILHELGRYEEAIACCDWILETDPKHIDSWYNKKLVLQSTGKMTSTMPQKYLERMRRIAQEVLELKSMEGFLQLSTKEPDDNASKEKEGSSNVSLFTEFGWQCMKDGKYDRAAAAFKNSVQIDKDYSAYLDLSLAYRRMRKMKRALQYCEKAAEFMIRCACRSVADEDEHDRLPREDKDRFPGFLEAVYNLLLQDPNYASLCSSEGYILLALGRDIEARQMFLESDVCGQRMEFLCEADEDDE